jgi:hypothetical protein
MIGSKNFYLGFTIFVLTERNKIYCLCVCAVHDSVVSYTGRPDCTWNIVGVIQGAGNSLSIPHAALNCQHYISEAYSSQ